MIEPTEDQHLADPFISTGLSPGDRILRDAAQDERAAGDAAGDARDPEDVEAGHPDDAPAEDLDPALAEWNESGPIGHIRPVNAKDRAEVVDWVRETGPAAVEAALARIEADRQNHRDGNETQALKKRLAATEKSIKAHADPKSKKWERVEPLERTGVPKSPAGRAAVVFGEPPTERPVSLGSGRAFEPGAFQSDEAAGDIAEPASGRLHDESTYTLAVAASHGQKFSTGNESSWAWAATGARPKRRDPLHSKPDRPTVARGDGFDESIDERKSPAEQRGGYRRGAGDAADERRQKREELSADLHVAVANGIVSADWVRETLAEIEARRFEEDLVTLRLAIVWWKYRSGGWRLGVPGKSIFYRPVRGDDGLVALKRILDRHPASTTFRTEADAERACDAVRYVLAELKRREPELKDLWESLTPTRRGRDVLLRLLPVGASRLQGDGRELEAVARKTRKTLAGSMT